MDPAMIEFVKDWTSPKSPTEIRQFLGLAGYYRRFIEGFSKITKPMTKLTQKKKELNMRQRQWLELRSDYDCDIHYHLGKANDVPDALSRKEREPPLRVRALVMTISLDLPRQILNAQTEARKLENIKKDDVGAISIFVSFIFASTCCVATDALGMLGTIATGVVIEAYGPICDNDGFIDEMAGMTVRIKQASTDGSVQILHRPPKALNMHTF
nr:retrotransposon protein, putative, Ty3-gypsy subclass [Tanacetum cinerariifolium]